MATTTAAAVSSGVRRVQFHPLVRVRLTFSQDVYDRTSIEPSPLTLEEFEELKARQQRLSSRTTATQSEPSLFPNMNMVQVHTRDFSSSRPATPAPAPIWSTKHPSASEFEFQASNGGAWASADPLFDLET